MRKINMQLLAVVLFMALAFAEDFDPNYSYEDFNRTYPRDYQGQEWAIHEAAFKKNYAKLLEYKREGHDVQINNRLDWTQEQQASFFTYSPQTSQTPPSARPLTSSQLFASPSSFDWRTRGVVTPVKDQGSCGSCWSFASTGQYESMLAIATKGTLYDLAEQYGLQCDNTSFGCNGGYPHNAIQLFQNTGIPLETAYPYSPYTSYPNICSNSAERVKISQTVNTVNFYYYQNLTVEQLQQDLVNYGPIGVGVYASGSFSYTGSSGLIGCTYPGQIDHAILLVGYNTTHWFVKNSWGTTGWGDNGYGYISKNTNNDCHIRQYVTEMVVDFGFQPYQDNLNLTITLSDSAGDGWNGNVLAIKQNNTIVGTFGDTFTSGSTKGPFYIVVQPQAEVRIVVTTLGTMTNQIGFVVKASNGTIIHQRNSGSTFTYGTVFSTFCPTIGCPQTMDLTVTLTGSDGDGWNGNIFGFKQNKTIVGTFGGSLTTGSSSGPVYITVTKNLNTQIVLTTLGTQTNEVGFVVKAPNGTVIYERLSGTPFITTTYFTIFCPDSDCPNTMDLTITLSDSGSNGWNYNVLGFKQNGTIVGTFGNDFTSGASAGPLEITIPGNLSTQIVVVALGLNSQEVGFVIKAANGTVIYQRNSGSSFYQSFIFSIFCPVSGCAAPSPSYITLSISMTDSGNDGWNNNILGIKQNNSIVGIFGDQFTLGDTAGPVSIIVQGNLATQIVVVELGAKSNEIGFIVTGSNGAIIYQRTSGTTFTSTKRFATFCPVSGCANLLTLTITMTDSGSDGWNSNVLGIRQLNEDNSVIDTFGAAFTAGASSGPLYVTILGNYLTEIYVYTLGTNTNQVGFVVKASNGTVIYTKTSGSVFTASTIFTTFCPIGGCPNINPYILTITMTDSGGNGWSGNILSIMQNDNIVGTFGGQFTQGAQIDPIYLQVQPNITGTILVSQLGANTSEVGFVIKVPNGTIIYQRASGSNFNSDTIFGTFCLMGGCPEPTTLKLTITMTDSYGDGWNGNILAIRQNNTIIGTFGSTFTEGSSTSPVYIVVQGSLRAQIIVSTIGSYTYQIGFVVKAANGTIIYQHTSGDYFNATTIFQTFCPIRNCQTPSSITYYLKQIDSYGDGWEGTILAFKQASTLLYTFTLENGFQDSFIPFTFISNDMISVTVYILGNYTNEIGVQVYDGLGGLVFNRSAGVKFFANTLLGTFCIECVNSQAVDEVPGRTEIRQEPQQQEQPSEEEVSIHKGYMIATYALASVLVVFMAISAISIVLNRKLLQKIANYQSAMEEVVKTKETATAESAQNIDKVL